MNVSKNKPNANERNGRNSKDIRLKRHGSSKLSQGPKNCMHKTFVRNRENINAALCKRISRRQVDIKAKEIYRDAGITGPTFYLHYRSTSDALLNYEKSMENALRNDVPIDAKREVFYVILTNHVAKNRKYFRATAKGGDHYLLHKIIASYRDNLVGGKIGDRAFLQYVGSAVVVIYCWLELDGITPETTEMCVKELIRIRPIRW